MRKVRDLVEQAGASLSVHDVAATLDLGARHFSALFKATTGQTFRSYVADRRIQMARTLLKESDLLIKQVAYRCGFGGTAAFTAAFHKAVGVSPVAYRDGNAE
nr:helix-turn-helix transcriptional regulator [Sphingobium fontiphilum]